MCQQPLAIARDQVDFQVDLAAGVQAVQGGVFQGVRDQVDGEIGAIDLVGGQARAIDHDGAFAGNEPGNVFGGADFEQTVVADWVKAQDLADAIDMTGNQMATDHVVEAQGFFQVDRTGGIETDGAGEGFRLDIDHEGVGFFGNEGQAYPVVCNRVTQCDIVNIQFARLDSQSITNFAGCELRDAAYCRNDS